MFETNKESPSSKQKTSIFITIFYGNRPQKSFLPSRIKQKQRLALQETRLSLSLYMYLLSMRREIYLWAGWKTWAAILCLSLVRLPPTRLAGPNISGWCLWSCACETVALPSKTSCANVAHVIGCAGLVYCARTAASRCQPSALLVRSSRTSRENSSPSWIIWSSCQKCYMYKNQQITHYGNYIGKKKKQKWLYLHLYI